MASRRSYHHGDLRRALLDAALAMLAAEGVDALSFRSLGRAVGVDHTAAYRHFEDKRALLAALAEEGFDALAAAIEAAAESKGEPLDKLVAMFRAYVEFALAERNRYAVMFGPRLNEDARHPSLEAAIRRVTKPLEDVVKSYESTLPTIDVILSLWITAHGYATLVLARRIKVKSRAAALDHFEALTRPQLEALVRSRA